MLSPNNAIGIKENPLTMTPFVQIFVGEDLNPPPPGEDIRITDDGSQRITDALDLRVTD